MGFLWDTESFHQIGISEYGEIAAEKIPFQKEVQEICEGNVCGNYGATWACPPAVGSFSECQKRCFSYPKALVFSTWYPLDDPFDLEGMQQGHRDFKEVCDRLWDFCKDRVPQRLLLSNEGCLRCKTCTYPLSPCRFPERLFPSLEGFGIYVPALAERAGIPYHHGELTVTYFGMLLYSTQNSIDS